MELKHLLVPLDGSDLSREALRVARRLVARVADPSFTLLEVVGPGPSGAQEHLRGAALQRLRGEAEELLAETVRVRRSLKTPGPSRPRVVPLVELGRPADEILRAAGTGFEAVVMTTHGRSGLGRAVRGSVAEEVLRRSPIPVLLSTSHGTRLSGPGEPFLRLLVPLDGSELAYRALPLAATVARQSGAEVVLFRSEAEEAEPGCLEHAERLLRERGVRRIERLIDRSEGPAAAILAAIERCRADLAVMTTHGRSGLERLRLGSVAEEVLRASPCPVLVKRLEASPVRS